MRSMKVVGALDSQLLRVMAANDSQLPPSPENCFGQREAILTWNLCLPIQPQTSASDLPTRV